MEKETLEALNNLIDYIWENEKDDYEAQGRPRHHIFYSALELDRWLYGQNLRREYSNLED